MIVSHFFPSLTISPSSASNPPPLHSTFNADNLPPFSISLQSRTLTIAFKNCHFVIALPIPLLHSIFPKIAIVPSLKHHPFASSFQCHLDICHPLIFHDIHSIHPYPFIDLFTFHFHPFFTCHSGPIIHWGGFFPTGFLPPPSLLLSILLLFPFDFVSRSNFPPTHHPFCLQFCSEINSLGKILCAFS
jgi:hypothetical protein